MPPGHISDQLLLAICLSHLTNERLVIFVHICTIFNICGIHCLCGEENGVWVKRLNGKLGEDQEELLVGGDIVGCPYLRTDNLL